MPPDQTSVTDFSQPQIRYAGFWLRFLALTLDALLIVIIVIVVYIAGVIFGEDLTNNIGMAVLQMALTWTYFIVLTNRNQATIGKKLLGLRVVSEDGTHLSLGKIIFRETIGRFISILVLGIGYLMVAFTSKKQGLHDKMVGSVVLSNRAERKTWAFVTSIILAVVFTVLPVIVSIGVFFLSITLATLNVAHEEVADAQAKSNLSIIRVQAEIVFDLNGYSYATTCTDQNIKQYATQAEIAVEAESVCNANKEAYAVYIPLKNSTAPNTGWCIDSTGTSRESVDLGTATACP